jgi:TolB-like protein
MRNPAFLLACFISLSVFPAGCATGQNASESDELDEAIRSASDYLNGSLPKGSKAVVLNFQSEYPSLSEYVIDELISNMVNDKTFTVVDRANLALVQREINFQMSGDVSDDTAVSIGEMLGAQIIVSGTVSRIGSLIRLRVRALDVRTAQIQGQFNRNIPVGPTVAMLIGDTAAVPVRNAGSASDAGNSRVADTADTQIQNPAAYRIGDTGPAGGIIFYDKGGNTGGWRYLEAAPPDTEKEVIWSHERLSIDGVTNKRAVGLGKSNTQTIMEVFNGKGGGFDTAARICADIDINGFNDWFLPSLDELSWMYGNLHQKGLGEFKGDNRYSYYWSSTQESSTGAFVIDFSNGRITHADILYTRYTRAVRRF